MQTSKPSSRRRVIVVTGASAGVGRAVACEFAKQGARIALIARGEEGLRGARADVERLGGEAMILPLDVADADALERAAATIEQTFGPIDIWINNAMTTVFAPVRKLTPAEIKRVTEVTYLGVVYGTMTALARMLPRDCGTIVQVGSALAYRGIPLQAAYCGAKHAIQGFCDSLHAELLHDRSNVRLTMVNLPAVNTPQFDWSRSKMPRRAQPVPPIFQPEVAAHAIAWAADHDRRELNVGWPTTKAVVGNNLFPGYGDHYLARHGVDSQMTGEPEDPHRPDNLWAPVPGDRGAHGRFDDRARDRSVELDLNLNRKHIATAIAIGLSALASRLRNGGHGSARKKERKARRLSVELREESTPELRRRRGVIALSMAASASMAYIALYQTGLIRHLGDPPLPKFDADRVDASAEAYEKFSTPDAVLGLRSYATTMGLAAMGGANRAKDRPWIPLALAAKVAFDVTQVVRMSIDQWTRQKAFCGWCLIAAAATLASAPLVVSEAREAAQTIRESF